jgi:hypothetical protein
MMVVKVKNLGEGLHPSEAFVSVETRDGPEELAVSANAVGNGTLPIGWPVGKQGDFLLVELPRPTVRGISRVWVRKEEVIPESRARGIA